MNKIIWCFCIITICIACKSSFKENNTDVDTISSTLNTDTLIPIVAADSELISNIIKNENQHLINTKSKITTHELVVFAKTLIGTPYKYASIDPKIGFDCSGFITFVFNHFNIEVPRSSVDFTNIGKKIKLEDAKEGDLILFSGTVDSIKTVGHMGIVTDNTDTLKFIHSTSGRKYGVTISELSNNYKSRFVKVIRIIFE